MTVCVSSTNGEVSLSAGVPKTVLQIEAPANYRLRVLRWTIAFDGVSTVAKPILVELMRQINTQPPLLLLPVALDDSISEPVRVAAGFGIAGVEPIAGNLVDSFYLHPQGRKIIRYPRGQEPIVSGSKLLGIRITAPASVHCRACIVTEE